MRYVGTGRFGATLLWFFLHWMSALVPTVPTLLSMGRGETLPAGRVRIGLAGPAGGDWGDTGHICDIHSRPIFDPARLLVSRSRSRSGCMCT